MKTRKIPIFGKDGCRYIMQLDTDYAREYIKLPNFFRTRIGRFVAVYAPDNCMDGAKIKKDSIVIFKVAERFALRRCKNNAQPH
ncbi:MAG: hypothetical protein L6V93_04260 [Clostridiales bacterium]|nr:MAG: hypothetical protein L6V93_04260 [Clostridiales bacterium]